MNWIAKTPTKRCPRCGQDKPRTAQNFKTRTTRAGTKTYRHCRECDHIEQAKWRAEHREHKQTYEREYRALNRDRLNARRREQRATRKRERERRARENRRHRKPRQPTPVPPGGYGPLLLADPFVAWVVREFPGWQTYEIAAKLAIDDSKLRRLITGESQRISLAVLDRALVSAGCPHLLAVWFPIPDEELWV